MTDDPQPWTVDECVLDSVFDLAFEAARSGSEVDRKAVDELLGLHPGLLARSGAVIQLAREHARPVAPGLPDVVGYEVLAEIGRGAMGQVYRARHRRLVREVALKVLPPHLASSPRARRRFLLEARSLARVAHPHVVPIHEVVEDGDTCAYAMELVHGTTLANAIGRSTTGASPLPIAHVCRIGVQLAGALAAVHGAGLLHRDVKPSNVLLRVDGTALLSDFGLVHDASADLQTKSGELLGTPAYAPPEQLRGEPLDMRSDVYALGVTLFEAAAAQLPHAARTADHRLLAIARGDVSPLRQVRRDAPRDLEIVLQKAMEADPADRYASAVELGDDLQRLIDLRPILARRPALLARACKFARRNRASVGAVLVTMVVLVFGFTLLLREVQRRAALPGQFGAQLQRARLALLQPESNSWMFRIAEADAGMSFLSTGESARLHTAVSAYDALATIGALSPAVAREREIVALADRLLRRDGELQQLSAPHGSAAMIAAFESTTNDREVWQLEPGSLSTMAVEERRALGLLAYCLTHVGAAVQAWKGLDLALDESDPLIDAALGQILLSQGNAAAAYPRLLRAADEFPEAGFLHVAVADAALACGDLAVAERFHAAAAQRAWRDVDGSLARQQIDLLLARGQVAAAKVRIEQLADPQVRNNPLILERHAMVLAKIGDVERALAVQRRLRGGWPQSRRLEGAARRLVGIWWQEQSTPRRIVVALRLLGSGDDLPELRNALAEESGPSPRQSQSIPPLLLQAAHVRRVVLDTWRSIEEPMLHLLRRAGWIRTLVVGGLGIGPLVSHEVVAQTPPSWTQLSPANSPGPINLQGMAYDSQRARTVMFGGHHDILQPSINETWEWDGSNWHQVNSTVSPPANDHISLAYDSARGRVVVFGTASSNGTWEFDGSNWLQRFPAQSPSPRGGASLAYDAARGRVVLFGGTNYYGYYHGDTWEWDGTNWSLRTPTNSPPPRSEGAMTYDPVRQRVVLVGGFNGGAVAGTWEWDGVNWAEVTLVASPPAASGGALVWHSGIQRLVYIMSWSGDAWVYEGTTWHPRCCATGFPPRSIYTAAYLPNTDRILVYGGYHSWGQNNTYADTWEFDVGSPPYGSATSFGTGCAGSHGIPDLQPLTPPVVGLTFQARLTNVAPGFAIFCLGWSNTQWNALPLPLPLGSIGLDPACTNYTSIDFNVWTLHSGAADYSLAIPCSPAFYGAVLYMQGASLDFALTTPIPIVVSNGLQVTLGG